MTARAVKLAAVNADAKPGIVATYGQGADRARNFFSRALQSMRCAARSSGSKSTGQPLAVGNSI